MTIIYGCRILIVQATAVVPPWGPRQVQKLSLLPTFSWGQIASVDEPWRRAGLWYVCWSSKSDLSCTTKCAQIHTELATELRCVCRSQTKATQQIVTKLIALFVINLVVAKSAAKCKLLVNKPASKISLFNVYVRPKQHNKVRPNYSFDGYERLQIFIVG
jgi:hypothetical protein